MCLCKELHSYHDVLLPSDTCLTECKFCCLLTGSFTTGPGDTR
jgi:hypothetical protein